MSIYIVGDVHNDIDLKKITTKSLRRRGIDITENDYMVFCGDWGGVWYGTEKDNYLINWYSQKPWTSVVVLGNHENYEAIERYPIVEWHGGRCREVVPNKIYIVERGEIVTLENKTFFCLGGAASHDKAIRSVYINWWPQELPNYKEFSHAANTLTKNKFKVDYIITHCGPQKILDLLTGVYNFTYEPDCLTNYLTTVDHFATYTHWFMGHYHEDLTFNNKTILYNDIVKLTFGDETNDKQTFYRYQGGNGR